MEVRYALETGGKRILVTYWQISLELCPVVMWKTELINDELGYLAEEISKQNVESTAWFICEHESAVSCEIHVKPARFLRILYQQKHCQLGLKKTEQEVKEGY